MSGRLGSPVRAQSLAKIMRQGRWKSERQALSYIRPATVFDDNATEGLGETGGKK